MASKKLIRSLLVISITAFSSLSNADELKDREAASKKVAAEFVNQLGTKLKAEMKAGGPVAAIKVCRDVAPDIANQLSLENGWRVTRVSMKPRNAMLGTADEWESRNLADFERRAGEGESYQDMTSSSIVLEGGKSYYRFMKPIPVQPVCLNCHGSDNEISPAVKAELDKYYPHDRATGYKVGDLRGAISIKQPIDTLIAPAN
jgi:hypothetical protein